MKSNKVLSKVQKEQKRLETLSTEEIQMEVLYYNIAIRVATEELDKREKLDKK